MEKIKIKVKPKKQRCWKCKKTSGTIKFYLFPNSERIGFYHSACFKSLKINQKKK